jgi:hypothetical protein
MTRIHGIEAHSEFCAGVAGERIGRGQQMKIRSPKSEIRIGGRPEDPWPIAGRLFRFRVPDFLRTSGFGLRISGLW